MRGRDAETSAILCLGAKNNKPRTLEEDEMKTANESVRLRSVVIAFAKVCGIGWGGSEGTDG